MPKLPTFPVLFDEAIQIKIADLRRLGFFKDTEKYVSSKRIYWSEGESVTASIWVRLVMDPDHPIVEISYQVRGRDVKSLIRLESKPSNLGKGKCWYFICPATGKRCRVLYGIDDYFYSRYAFPSAMYSTQTESKRWRDIRIIFEMRDARKKMFGKHSRTHYNGKPTRRFAKWLANTERDDKRLVRVRDTLDRMQGLEPS